MSVKSVQPFGRRDPMEWKYPATATAEPEGNLVPSPKSRTQKQRAWEVKYAQHSRIDARARLLSKPEGELGIAIAENMNQTNAEIIAAGSGRVIVFGATLHPFNAPRAPCAHPSGAG
jgi:hypothetical protein